ncbi:MAG: hypothetical protein MUC63_07145, partial [Planctomycetes bacterium]|nr:hypothetical protein [Planctomycetota bacterium]
MTATPSLLGIRAALVGALVLAAPAVLSAAENPLEGLRALREAFSKLSRENPFDRALAALDRDAAGKDDLARAAALEAKADLLARRDLRKNGDAVFACLAGARDALRAVESRLPAADAAALAAERWALRFRETEYARFLPDGRARAAGLYRSILAESPPPDARARALYLLAFRLLDRDGAGGEDEARREACALLEEVVARHSGSPLRPAALYRLAVACFAPFENLSRNFPDREARDRAHREWSAARDRSMELLDQILAEKAPEPWARRAAARKRVVASAFAVVPDSETDRSLYTSAGGTQRVPDILPGKGAAVPAEDLEGWTGTWTLRKAAPGAFTAEALLRGELPPPEAMPAVRTGAAADGHPPV